MRRKISIDAMLITVVVVLLGMMIKGDVFAQGCPYKSYCERYCNCIAFADLCLDRPDHDYNACIQECIFSCRYGNPTTTSTTPPITTTIQPTTTTTTTPPTVIELSSFTVIPQNHKAILQWSTESETDNAGFNIYRSESENGEYTKINPFLIPAQGSSTQGAFYEFVDNDVQNRKTYYYKLEDIDLNGKSTMHGPVSATPRLIFGLRN